LKILGYSLAILLLGLAVALKLSWQEKEQILPKNRSIKLITILKKEPKIYNAKQILEIGDGKIYVDLYPRYKIGDQLAVEGEIDSTGQINNPRIQKVGQKASLAGFFGNFRAKIAENINKLLPSREATLVGGAVLGVDEIEQEFRDQLVKTGTIHAVVVSGQNLMIVAGVFLSLAKIIGRRQSLVLATTASFGYALLTGFEPPVVRATLMVLASTLAIYFGREALPIWSLILAALLIVFVWPQAIFEVSFQLTFAATLGIMTLGRRLANLGPKSEARISKSETNTNVQNSKSKTVLNLNYSNFNIVSNFGFRISDLLIANAAIAISAYVFTAPIILYYFGKISLLAPMANILVVEAISPIMILGFLVAIVSLIFMPLAQLFAYFAFVPAFYFAKVVEVFAKIPVGQVNLGKGNVIVIVGFYIVVAILMIIWGREKPEP